MVIEPLIFISVSVALVVIALTLFGKRSRKDVSRYDERYGRTLHFHGTGEMTVRAPGWIASQYRLDYQFPETTLVKVDLLDTASGDRELIVLKSGAGVAWFEMSQPGDYLLHVAPLDEAAVWELAIRPVGLGSRTGRTD